MNKKTYTGSKIQNHFTAYLIQFVRGKRHDYLEKKIQMADAEELLEDIGQMEARIVIEELLENQTREQLLLQEAQGKYPEWNKMSDERLMKALHTLRDEERKLIYQHVFEERTFEEMSRLNGLSEEIYKPLLIKNAIVNGRFDEDLYQELVSTLLQCIQRFQIIE